MPYRRLLFILDNLSIGGVERNTISICNHLAKEGHDITLLCLTHTGPMAKALHSKVKFELLGANRIRNAFLKLIIYIRKNDFDAIISAKEYNNVLTIAASILSFKKTKIITTTRTNLERERKEGQSKIFATALFLAKYLYPLAYMRVGVSHGVAQSIKDTLKRPNMRVEVIYNPAANLEDFSISPTAPHPWFNEPIPVLLACGRLSAAKDYPLLLNAFAHLQQTTPARLIILGGGELEQSIKDKIKLLNLEESVFLYGPSSNPEDFMAHARLFVLTSKWEGFGNVLVEALSVGCPMVSADCSSGPNEILQEGKWGRLVKSRKPEDFAEAIREELEKPRPPRNFLQTRAKDFTPEKISLDYLKLLAPNSSL